MTTSNYRDNVCVPVHDKLVYNVSLCCLLLAVAAAAAADYYLDGSVSPIAATAVADWKHEAEAYRRTGMGRTSSLLSLTPAT